MARHYNHTFHEYILPDDVTSRKYLLDVNPWSWQRERGDGANIIDARWIDMRNGMYVDITALTKLDPNLHQGIWSCKAFHHYRTGELFPMRESTYEGVQAQVPYDYDRILIDEYGLNALVKTEFHGYVKEPPSIGHSESDSLIDINGMIPGKNGSEFRLKWTANDSVSLTDHPLSLAQRSQLLPLIVSSETLDI